MSKLATVAVAAGALALTLVTLAPSSAEAGWRRGHWGRGGVNVYVGPRWGAYRGVYGTGRYGLCHPTGYPYAYYPYWRNRVCCR